MSWHGMEFLYDVFVCIYLLLRRVGILHPRLAQLKAVEIYKNGENFEQTLFVLRDIVHAWLCADQ